MGWKETGAVRMRRFEAYRELEDRVKAAEDRAKELEKALVAKDNTIRTLARELGMVTGPLPAAPISPSDSALDLYATVTQDAEQRPSTAPPEASKPHTGPGVSKASVRIDTLVPKAENGTEPRGRVPLSRLFGEK